MANQLIILNFIINWLTIILLIILSLFTNIYALNINNKYGPPAPVVNYGPNQQQYHQQPVPVPVRPPYGQPLPSVVKPQPAAAAQPSNNNHNNNGLYIVPKYIAYPQQQRQPSNYTNTYPSYQGIGGPGPGTGQQYRPLLKYYYMRPPYLAQPSLPLPAPMPPVVATGGYGSYDGGQQVDDSSSSVTNTLVLVQVVHRHGDRTPLAFYTDDPYGQDYYWPEGLGELTNKGKQRLYAAGVQFRQRYDQFLGSSPKLVRMRSTSKSRCLESAQLMAAGLYRPRNQWIWQPSSGLAQQWQPVPVQTVPAEIDAMLYYGANCPQTDKIEANIMASASVKQYLETKQDFLKALNQALPGHNCTDLTCTMWLYDTLTTEFDYQPPKPYPGWMASVGVDRVMTGLTELNEKYYDVVYGNKQIQQLRSGILLETLINNMFNASQATTHTTTSGSPTNQNTPQPKLYVYTAHDIAVYTLMRLLYGTARYPSFGDAVVIELHLIAGQYYVRLYYGRNDPINYGYKFTGFGTVCDKDGDNSCSLDEFRDTMKDLFVTDWSKQCGLTNEIPIFT
ncbi:prostatic acid phosphatase-like [Oppia nitens]|uniref:prostatic acid phosphatase-like n=1 Tax=Oppia nitens TaxID=1686743 RepID=UPI0023DCC747|nr:prostatic acid phosphatase-like [Oppia nitens]